MIQQILQIVTNSISSGLILSLVAIGFTYIFKVTKVFHLAHAGIYTVSGYTFFWLFENTQNHFIAVSFSFLITSLLAYTIEKLVYLPINNSKCNQSISLVSSTGVYMVLINIIALFFGNENKISDNRILGSIKFKNIIITNIELIQIVFSLIALLLFFLYIIFSKSNLTLQSITDNEIISKVYGINTKKERVKIIIAGSVLACIAGILKTIDTGIEPQAGMGITLTASVVAILVSRLSISLIVLFSIALAILQNIIEVILNAQWRDGITFLILLLVILYKTDGIISYNLRKDNE